MKHVFIVGCKGIPANYGGYETFVENLTKRQINKNIKYYVACLGTKKREYEYNGAHCFQLKVPNFGPAKAVYYDLASLKYSIKFIKQHNIKNFIVYVLTCRVGPFYNKYVKKIHKLHGKVYLNPDGHEWMRTKWSAPVRKYWKMSEKLMVKHSDLIICDSINIEKYINDLYKKYNPKTTYIAYGAEVNKSLLKDDDEKLKSWYNKFNLKSYEYYLVVGRFVPENNFEIMIREFMSSKTTKPLVLITNVEQNKLYKFLQDKYHFEKDERIKFVGTIYDIELLQKIRENAFAYIHGHSVGGTNPSLLEGLAATKLNLLYNVGFNKECGRDSALYFTKEEGNLSSLIDECDDFSYQKLNEYGNRSTKEIVDRYNWNLIINTYEKVFEDK